MLLLAAVDPWYVAACTAIPILWGAVVHWLFDAWQSRRRATSKPAGPLDEEVQEANLP